MPETFIGWPARFFWCGCDSGSLTFCAAAPTLLTSGRIAGFYGLRTIAVDAVIAGFFLYLSCISAGIDAPGSRLVASPFRSQRDCLLSIFLPMSLSGVRFFAGNDV